MPLSDIVNVQISISSVSPKLPGFGIPLILDANSNFTPVVKTYAEASEMLDDGFLETDQAYLDAVALTTQEKRPRTFKVGRRSASPVAQVNTVTVTGADDGSYVITIDASTLEGSVTYTHAASGDTVTGIRDALVVLVNAGTQPVTAAPVSTDQLTLTADNAGQPNLISVSAPNDNLTLATTTANAGGIAEDLAAITDLDPDWYLLLLSSRTDVDNIVAASAIAPLNRLFFAQSSATEIKDSLYDSGTPGADLASRLKFSDRSRTAVWYHPTDTQSLAAAIAGRGLPETPGAITWKFKQLTGVTAVALTASEIANLKSKSANSYRTEAGVSFTFEGTVSESDANGEFIDVIRGVDKLKSQIESNVFTLLLSEPKVPYTDVGVAQILGQVRSAVEQSIFEGSLAASPAPTYTVPEVADIPSATRATRKLIGANAITFKAQLAGAIHEVDIVGTVSA
jgi:hypothetical protein